MNANGSGIAAEGDLPPNLLRGSTFQIYKYLLIKHNAATFG
jgi:hypothetical protein